MFMLPNIWVKILVIGLLFKRQLVNDLYITQAYKPTDIDLVMTASGRVGLLNSWTWAYSLQLTAYRTSSNTI